jgi:hypothetical protein
MEYTYISHLGIIVKVSRHLPHAGSFTGQFVIPARPYKSDTLKT